MRVAERDLLFPQSSPEKPQMTGTISLSVKQRANLMLLRCSNKTFRQSRNQEIPEAYWLD